MSAIQRRSLCTATSLLIFLGACSSGSTVAPIQVTASMIATRYPTPGALFATPKTKVRVQLKSTAALAEITNDVFYVEGPNGIVPASITYDSESKTATLTPDIPWSIDIKWTAHFGAQTGAAQPVEPSSWQFETRLGKWSDETTLHTATTTGTLPQHTKLEVDASGQATAITSYRALRSLDQVLIAVNHDATWQQGEVMASHGAFKDLQLSIAPSGHASVLGSRDDQLVWIQRPAGQPYWAEQTLPGSFLPPEFGVQVSTDSRGHSLAMWSAKGLSAVVSASHDGLGWSDDKVLTPFARSALLASNRNGQAIMASTNRDGLLTRRYTTDGEWLPKDEFASATSGLLDVGMSDDGQAWVAAIDEDANDIQSLLVYHSHPTQGWAEPRVISQLNKHGFVLEGNLSVGPHGYAAVVWQVSRGPGLAIDIFASVYDLDAGTWGAPHAIGINVSSRALIRTDVAVDNFGNVTALYWANGASPTTHTARYLPSIGWRKTLSFDGSHTALVSDHQGKTHLVGWHSSSRGMVLFGRTFE